MQSDENIFSHHQADDSFGTQREDGVGASTCPAPPAPEVHGCRVGAGSSTKENGPERVRGSFRGRPSRAGRCRFQPTLPAFG